METSSSFSFEPTQNSLVSCTLKTQQQKRVLAMVKGFKPEEGSYEASGWETTQQETCYTSSSMI